MKKQIIPSDGKIPVKLSIRERDLIRDKTSYDPSFAILAVVDDDGVRIFMTHDDLDDLIGCVAGKAYQIQTKGLQNEFCRLFNKLQGYLDRYEE
jgi:hypothetical protein